MMISKNNMFTYGEVGERLGGIREADIYQQSAQVIENLIINEMGNLKSAKKFIEVQFSDNSIKQIIDTKYNFYVCINNGGKVCTYSKVDGTIGRLLYWHPVVVADIRVVKMADDKLFVIGDTTKVYEFNKDNGQIGVSNFLSLMELPIKDKEVVKIDVYRTYQVQEELRVSLLGSYDSPRFDTSGGTIKIEGSNVVLSRLYKQYKASVSKENIASLSVGLTFGVFRNYFEKEDSKQYYIGNTPIEFGGVQTDNTYGGQYFTSVTGNGRGELVYGKLLKINENITTVGLYQDRLVIINDGTFYFSKKSEYLDFRNDTKLDSAFYFKPTPINNIYPEIYDMYIGDRIYVPTSKGIYVVSTNNILTSNAYSVFIASELPAHNHTKYSFNNKCTIFNNSFYYLTNTNELRSVEQTPIVQGIESYSSTLVEKYELNSKFNSIHKFNYNNKQYLVAYRNTNKIYMYEQLDYKLFRRYSITLPKTYKKLIIVDKTIITENSYLLEGTENIGKCKLKLNPPDMQGKGGSYSNDFSSRVQRVFMKVLNEEKKAIKGIRINNTLITKSAIEDDLFSVFKIETSFPVLNGYEIEIITNENDKIFEILGIDTIIDVVSD